MLSSVSSAGVDVLITIIKTTKNRRREREPKIVHPKRILLYSADTLVIIVTPVVVEIGSPLSTSMLKSYDMAFGYLTVQNNKGKFYQWGAKSIIITSRRISNLNRLYKEFNMLLFFTQQRRHQFIFMRSYCAYVCNVYVSMCKICSIHMRHSHYEYSNILIYSNVSDAFVN